MAQFALLMMMAVMPMMMLSGGMSPIESQPQWVQYVTWFFPSRHYVGFMQAIVSRQGLDIVWKEFVTVLVMGVTFLVMSLLPFRQSLRPSVRHFCDRRFSPWTIVHDKPSCVHLPHRRNQRLIHTYLPHWPING
jgi:hypothetical protein